MSRTATRSRATKETSISIAVNLDGTGLTAISTGIPFYDHMLDQLGRHGGFDLTIDAVGDLQIDTHHTVEDVAITLGETFREALGDKVGVRRFASGQFPLDEATPMVVTRTFSKTWSMAGARLGYLLGPSWVVDELDKVTLPYHLDAAKQIAGRLALRFVDDMEARVGQIVAQRDRIQSAFATMPVDYWPSGANFILFRPRASTGHTGRAVWQALLDHSVLVRDCSGWPRLENCLRVTVGTTDENDVFLNALAEVLT